MIQAERYKILLWAGNFSTIVTSGAADFLPHVAVPLCSYPPCAIAEGLHPPSLLILHSLLPSETDLGSCQRN